ncbi:dolichyl-diphosphooligosaccharide--protein glycosyltransferase subunit STT3, putative [Babesia caballi]|uniref:dolichyl-diphosphooligosaccharide--protein glycotransferase n=1 Tax=Babesia caballi TaxID=5871 RepID=A0AAV4LYW6_BABCB|nr:dolichyl-diphosphooligosaccharide--protein glycosyltransferase subunit STT3, putative [Babesia caballi]
MGQRGVTTDGMGGDGCLPGVRRWATGSRTILALIAAHGFLLRLFSAVKHEVVLHEYDPYFNYQCAQFMVRHGVRRFWDSFDAGRPAVVCGDIRAGSWYPVGRRVGRTVYPGLMLAAYGAYQTLHYIGLDVDLKTVCVFLPPVLSVGTVYAVYLLAREIAGSECASLASAFFVGSLPALLPRTSAGTRSAFDNESLAITLMVLSLYAWLRAVAGPSLLRSAAAAVATFLMALSWGGYVFVMNAVACFSLAAVVLRVDAERVSAVYVVYHPLAVALCYQVPMISNAIVGSLEMKFPHIVFAVSLLRLTASHAREQYRRVASGGEHRTDEALGSDRHGAPTVPIIQRLPPTLTVIGAPLVALLWLLMVERRSEGHSTLTGRLQSLFSPGKAKIGNPLVASISEHQPTRWTNMVLDFWVTLVYNPIGFYVCFKNGLRVGYLSLAIYGVVASYFAAAMVRLGLIFAPAAAILSGLGVTYTLENCVRAKKVSTTYEPRHCCVAQRRSDCDDSHWRPADRARHPQHVGRLHHILQPKRGVVLALADGRPTRRRRLQGRVQLDQAQHAPRRRDHGVVGLRLPAAANGQPRRAHGQQHLQLQADRAHRHDIRLRGAACPRGAQAAGRALRDGGVRRRCPVLGGRRQQVRLDDAHRRDRVPAGAPLPLCGRAGPPPLDEDPAAPPLLPRGVAGRGGGQGQADGGRGRADTADALHRGHDVRKLDRQDIPRQRPGGSAGRRLSDTVHLHAACTGSSNAT